jgi:hypothetical protein
MKTRSKSSHTVSCETYLSSLLQSQDGSGLEPQVSLEVLGDLTHQPLEGQLADQQLSALLVPPDLTQRHCAWPVAVGLLDASCSGCALASCLGGELLAWGLAASALSCCLERCKGVG